MYKLAVLPTNSNIYRIYKGGKRKDWVGIGYYYKTSNSISLSCNLDDLSGIRIEIEKLPTDFYKKLAKWLGKFFNYEN